MSFTCHQDVFDWTTSYANLERTPSTGRDYRLDRMTALAALLGNPQNAKPSIHVAGSKGKGTTCTLLAASLGNLGIRTGLYRSPHILDWRERICHSGGYFDDRVYMHAATTLQQTILACEADPMWQLGPPTTFELLTLLAFLIFRDEDLGCAVYETGLGGRLDATNLVTPELSIITHLELEHTDILGPHITDIAREKAGIIKAGRPVFTAPQTPPALEVLKARAQDLTSPLRVIVPDHAPGSTSAQPVLAWTDGSGTSHSMPIAMPGLPMVENATLALTALMTLRPRPWLNKAEDMVLNAFACTVATLQLPGRATILTRETTTVVCDGAHTPDSSAEMLATFLELFPAVATAESTLLFAQVEGKQSKAIAELLVPHFSRIIISRPGTWKTSKPEEILAIFRTSARNDQELSLIIDEDDALDAALAQSRHILACGSFHLIAKLIPRLLELGFTAPGPTGRKG